MKKQKVILLAYTPDPMEAVSLAARLCYSPLGIDSIKEDMTKDRQKGLIEKLLKSGHLSPLEHASFTFAVEGISRACSHQLVRHRLASYSQQSQRYVSMERGFDYIIPPSIESDTELRVRFVAFMEKTQDFYNEIVSNLKQKGMKGEEAYEDARFILPNAAETKIILTMNARELLHFFTQRCCMRAQWEIRQMARKILKLVKAVAPDIFVNAGPQCLRGRCPEGQFSCGKTEEVRRMYKDM
ncbi:MAG: FAD-dependent thymidylate synthase [Syntrophorhabdaceae bacterium]|nr:FAD-dependent thymidylate synthase [Syntrophorhabdaceae bacterium]